MKPLKLQSANGLQFTPEETAGILTLLFQIGFSQPNESDRQFARDLLLKTAMTYPQYANFPNNKKK